MSVSFVVLHADNEDDECNVFVRLFSRDEPNKPITNRSEGYPDLNMVVRSGDHQDLWRIGVVNLTSFEADAKGIRWYVLAPCSEYRKIAEGEEFDVL